MLSRAKLVAGKIKQFVLFSILPILNFLSSQVLLRVNGPYYLGPNFDPAYVYLFNAINIAHRITPGHYDHPGTPVQIFGAIFGLIRFAFRTILNRADTFYLDVLRNPEAYLVWFNLVMNLLIVLVLLVGGTIIYRLSGRIIAVVVFQITPLIFSTILKSTTQFTPEPFLLIVVLCLMVLFYYQLKEGINKTSKGYLIAMSMGILVGLGIAIKITFLPLVLLLLIFWDIKKIAISLVSIFVTGIAFTLPIASQYIKFIEWIKNLLIHSGIYGGGERGLPEINHLVANAVQLFVSEPAFFALMFLSIVFNIWIFFKQKAWNLNRKWVLSLSIINGVFLSQTAVTIKHPPIHYMLASLGLSSLLIFVFLDLTEDGKSVEKRTLANSIILLWIAAALLFTLKTTIADRNKTEQYISENKQITQIILSEYADCQVADYYRSSTQGFALSFGNDFVKDRFSDPLQQIYPNTLVYEKWERNFHRFGEVLSTTELNEVLEYNCLLLRGSPIKGTSIFSDAMTVLPIHVGNYEALYIVNSLQSIE